MQKIDFLEVFMRHIITLMLITSFSGYEVHNLIISPISKTDFLRLEGGLVQADILKYINLNLLLKKLHPSALIVYQKDQDYMGGQYVSANSY